MVSLSVIVPCYQGAGTLSHCLEAALAALPVGAELLVVDDGSTDGSAQICERLGVRCLRHGQNRGTSAARNTGWRHSRGTLVAFVDADVIVAPDALTQLQRAMEACPDAAGANGIYALDPGPDPVTDFANLSIHYQHQTHGSRVGSTFTALCVLRRQTLEQMGGWDERFGTRYADDVNTRYQLPGDAIMLVPQARGVHLKRVTAHGLLRHRFNVGWHFVGALRIHRTPRRALLGLRYPLNTALAGLTILTLPTPAVLLPVLAFPIVNAPFARFVAHHRGPGTAALAVGASAVEGFAYLAGMTAAVVRGDRS